MLSQPLTGRTVLVIDNEKAILVGMQSLLGGWGANVITGMTLDEAERRLEQITISKRH